MKYTVQIFMNDDWQAITETELSEAQIRDESDFLYIHAEDGSETGYNKSMIREYRLIPVED